LAPRSRASQPLDESLDNPLANIDPIASTEALALDFVRRGGKYSRPFITLATYDALTTGRATLKEGPEVIAEYTDAVLRAVMSIEMFHKASLLHDDIEDDDGYRYGQPTMHQRYGLSTAINVGDYLIGLGYRMVSRDAATLGPAVAADILDCMAGAHTRLAEGQGAELLWRDAGDKRLTPLDALKVYALKTSPAFEAALLTGARLAGDVTEIAAKIAQVERLYSEAKVFDQARRLVEKHERRALEAAAAIPSEAMQRLLLYLVDTVLERHEPTQPKVVPVSWVSTLPIADK